jgi:NhaC family Na+:H+ antiporter
MSTATHNTALIPSLTQALVCFLGIFGLLSTGLFLLAVDLHSLMFLCLLWAGAHAAILGYDFHAIRRMMSEAISQALPAIYIFVLIGMVIASFMQAGTIASLIYFGLSILNPAWFLVVSLLLCSAMSLATGTSWGTAGTMGVVLMGIGGAMGVPLPLVAGTVVAGATFGDKMSPISDTTNLAAMSAGTSLYRHIGSMLYTTLPTYLLTLVLLAGVGAFLTPSTVPGSDIDTLRRALAGAYRLQPFIVFLPLLVMVVLSVRRVAAEVTMSASIVTACLVAIFYQGTDFTVVLNALWLNTPGNTGIENLDGLLGRGGISSMAWTLLLALMALALGGVLHESGMLARLLAGLLLRVKRVGALIATTIAAGLVGNMAMGEAYISIILNCQLFKSHYQAMSLDPAVLSRSVEEGSTLTTGLIPWTTAGAFYSATLGVSVIEYAPYAFFNYLNGVVAVVMATLGIGLMKEKVAEPSVSA